MESNANVQVKIDENSWVIQIKKNLHNILRQDEQEEENCMPVFNVPKDLLALKPQAYLPQTVSIGPYHHWRSELNEMERYKLAAARTFQKRINGRKFECVVVEEFKKHDWQIRRCYHKFIDYKEETLAWLMALDATFLLECLQFYVRQTHKSSSHTDVKQLGRVLRHSAGTSSVHNSVLRDVMMLENQLPLFLLQKLLEVQLCSEVNAEERLCSLVKLVCQELSPFGFKLAEDWKLNIKEGGHVLGALYSAIVPVSYNQDLMEEEREEPDTVDMSTVTEASNMLCKTLCAINVEPIRFLNKLLWRVLNWGPLRFVMKFPLPLLGRLLCLLVDEDAATKCREESSGSIIPPSQHELNIPSVTHLYSAGVKFSPTNGDLATVHFDEKTAMLYLPRIMLDANTEVILRNLVAFEASAAPGAPVLRRYTDFMNGLIDSENDVRLLRKSGIISKYLKSDGEVTSLWNSMGNCIRLREGAYLDKVIKDLNIYSNRKWNVVVVEFVNKHIFGSWKFLSLVAAAIMLGLTCLQAYCSLYTCKRWLNQSSP